jgi:hypothetical protein
MNSDILVPIITGASGLAAGYFGALSKWHVKKLKMRREERLLLIKELRAFISSDEFSTEKFKDTILYSRFRKHLPNKITEQIDCKDGIIRLELHLAGSRDGLQNELLDQLCVLEEKWKLI